MTPRVLRRFIILMALMTAGTFIFTDLFDDFITRPPGDMETEMGSLRLEDGKYDEALDYYDQALTVQPNHRGALMGRALVFIQTERYDEAIAELDYLIAYLSANLAPDDMTGRAALAAAYANRGTVHDRQGRYETALGDYIESLRTDADIGDGPGVVHQILYGSDNVSSVRGRARYIAEQLQKPAEERLMRIPEIDDQQRMYKP